MDKNFKMPRIWRSNIAADIELPGNMIFTMEALYSKDINAIVQKNVNQSDPDRVFNGSDNRPYWSTNKVNSNIGSAMVLDNSSKGYQTLLTAQLTKNYTNGFAGMIAYTYNLSKDVSSNPGSAAYSAWSSNLDVFDLNSPQLSYSNFAVPHRVVGYVSYRVDYIRHLATTFSLYYNGAAQGRSSYAYSNDMTGDGLRSNLIYVPKDKNDLVFVDVPGKMTAAEQADRFWEYVNGDSYLKSRKGKYSERFGKVNPWLNRWDVKILQDIYTNFGSDRRYSLQVSLDIVNAGNLLNKDWGIYKRSGLANQYDLITPLTYRGVNHLGEPTFTLNATDIANFNDKDRMVKQATTASTWGMLLGIRLSF